MVRLWFSSIPPEKKGYHEKFLLLTIAEKGCRYQDGFQTFSCGHGLNEIELTRLGGQGCRPVLDHPSVQNPLHRRWGVSQDPALEGGIRARNRVDSGFGHDHLGLAGKLLRLHLLPRLVRQSDRLGADGWSPSRQSPADWNVFKYELKI